MFWTLLVTTLAATAPQGEGPVIRTVSVAAYTKKLEPVTDLKPEEIVVSEGKRKAPVLGVEADSRPLAAAIVIDSSAALASEYRSELVAAVVAFWKRLPAGSRVAVWTSGPPSRVVDFGGELAAAEPRLQSIAPAGKNYAIDAMLDASRALEQSGAERRVLVFVGGIDVEASRSRTGELQQAVGRAAATPMLVLIVPGVGSVPMGGQTQGAAMSWDVQGYLEQMAAAYGGSAAVVLTSQAATKKLQEAAVDLSSQYQVRYESTADARGFPKLEIRRKDVKLRVGSMGIEVARIR
jgi:hypothetical protein